MTWRLLIFALVAGYSFAAEETVSTNGPARGSYEAFQIVAQRNIFNPNRSGGSQRRDPRETSKAARTESFALVGTMMWEKGSFAFFDSASSDYRRVIKADDSIAGYKVAEVTPSGVKLEADGKTIELAVGQRLQKQDEGEWTVGGKPAAESPDASSSTGSSSSSSGDEDAILQRLLKKREEELNK